MFKEILIFFTIISFSNLYSQRNKIIRIEELKVILLFLFSVNFIEIWTGTVWRFYVVSNRCENRLKIIGIGGCRQSMMNLEVTFKMICPDLLMGLANLIRSLCNSDARLNNSRNVHCILGTDIDRLFMIKYNFTHVLIPDCD